ncbi:TolC family protein [Flavobacterium croceum]|nr:TolC family protein [Flavobacterium croceum]
MYKKSLIIYLFFIVSVFGQEKKWTLKDCIEHAVKNNISIQQSALDSQTADINYKAAIGDFMPNVNASASHSWNIGLNQNITTGLLENQTTQFTSAGINANVPIYSGLQNQNRLSRARLTQTLSQLQLAKMKDDIALNIANAYLQILYNKENLKVQKEQLANDEKQYTKIDETVKAGSLPKGDLLDAKATVANDKQKIVNAENTLFLSKIALAQLLQLDDYKNFDIAEADYAVQNYSVMQEAPETIIDKAKQQRVELKIAQANVDIAQKDIKIAQGALQPSLTGFYSFSARATYSDRIVIENGMPVVAGPLPFFDQLSQYKGHNFGVQLNIPIFNGFASKYAVDRAKIAAKRSQNNLTLAQQELEKNVYTAVSNAKGAYNNYLATQASLDARKEAFNYAKEKFAVGMMNSFDYSQAQTLFVNAQSNFLNAKYDYIFKVKIVEFYYGLPLTIN